MANIEKCPHSQILRSNAWGKGELLLLRGFSFSTWSDTSCADRRSLTGRWGRKGRGGKREPDSRVLRGEKYPWLTECVTGSRSDTLTASTTADITVKSLNGCSASSFSLGTHTHAHTQSKVSSGVKSWLARGSVRWHSSVRSTQVSSLSHTHTQQLWQQRLIVQCRENLK